MQFKFRMFILSFLNYPDKYFQTESKTFLLGTFLAFKNLYIYLSILYDIENRGWISTNNIAES